MVCAVIVLLGVHATAAPVPVGVQLAEVDGLHLVHSRLTELPRPTSLDLGPDGRLYVSEVEGRIHALSIARVDVGVYRVTASETIDVVRSIANHDADGTPRPDLDTRLVTGLVAAGTAAAPVLFVTSSDPRRGDKGAYLGTHPTSGVVSKLTRGATGWQRVDLVTGLPRSAEDHAPHGLALLGRTLLVAQGGNTNMGAPSRSFALFPETPLSAAVLAIDLDHPERGARVFAPGFRNPYDVAVTADGQVYVTDNGPNRTWGGPPVDCTDTPREGGATHPDTLHRIVEGTYGGHPNPARGVSDPRQCVFLDAKPSAVATFPTSTNGLVEYRGPGPLHGHLLTVSFSGELNAVDPRDGSITRVAEGMGAWPVDVTAQGPEEPWPGTIWVAVHAQDRIQVLEPQPDR